MRRPIDVNYVKGDCTIKVIGERTVTFDSFFNYDPSTAGLDVLTMAELRLNEPYAPFDTELDYSKPGNPPARRDIGKIPLDCVKYLGQKVKIPIVNVYEKKEERRSRTKKFELKVTPVLQTLLLGKSVFG